MKHKRVNRLLLIWLLPFIIFMWLVGWTLYCLGAETENRGLVVTGDGCLERLEGKQKKETVET